MNREAFVVSVFTGERGGQPYASITVQSTNEGRLTTVISKWIVMLPGEVPRDPEELLAWLLTKARYVAYDI